MNQTVRYTGKTRSIPAGLAISAGVSMGITLILSAGIAYGLNAERMTWEQAGYWIMGMLFAASFLGGKSIYAAVRRQRLAVSILSGVLYWGLLLFLAALFFGGEFQAVGVTAGIIFAGSMVSALISRSDSGKRSTKKGRGNR